MPTTELLISAYEIQERLDALAASMLAKGLVQPKAAVWFESLVEPKVTLHWEDMRRPKGIYQTINEYFRKGSLTEKFDAAAAFVAALPSAEETKLQDFMSALGNVIDMGRANGIDVAYVNPLSETMKKLSENIITHVAA